MLSATVRLRAEHVEDRAEHAEDRAEHAEEPAEVCEFYPLVLSSIALEGVEPGGEVTDSWRGKHPESCGFLTWTGDPSVSALLQSLTEPGDSENYINPANPNDRALSVGDWVRGKVGVTNTPRIHVKLDVFKERDIVVPIWDQMRSPGTRYMSFHVSAFARVRLLSYDLPRDNLINVRFIEYVTCAEPVKKPSVSAGNLNTARRGKGKGKGKGEGDDD
jgi:hypothetical protein